jgi:hypothetical protein
MTIVHAPAEVVGFAPEEINTGEPTRAARLKWVVAVDEALPAGLAVNAAACVAASTGSAVAGLLGSAGKDASGFIHPGLPWAGCTVLAARSEQLTELRDKASGSIGVFVADMPRQAQTTRIYDEYLHELSQAEQGQIVYYAVGVIGPRNRVDKLVKKLSLLA